MSLVDALIARAMPRARAVRRRLSALSESRWRQVPRFPVLPADDGPATVYYLLPEPAQPQGGVRVGYRHVDVLGDLGWQAAVLHRTKGYRAGWFENSTPIVSVDALRFKAHDILVVPEVYGPSLGDIDPRVRVMIFNQNGYYTFDGMDLASCERGAPYAGLARLEGIMTVSQDSAALLRLAFPDAPIHVVRPVVDDRVFRPADTPPRHVVAMPTNRRHEERHLLRHLLRAAGVDWELVLIEGMSEVQVAEALRRAAVFISLNDRDGFGLPPAEAMACGAYVVGYPGGGGKEFFDPAYCTPVTGTAELVRAVQDAIALPDEARRERGLRASRAILERYGEAGLKEDLVRVFAPVLGAAAGAH